MNLRDLKKALDIKLNGGKKIKSIKRRCGAKGKFSKSVKKGGKKYKNRSKKNKSQKNK